MSARLLHPVLLMISAPSGTGKTTVCANLLAAVPALHRAVTCTTRAPRPGERPGTDYHFLGAEEFAAGVAAGEFLEHATVYGNRYGTLKSEVLGHLRAGRDLLLNIDVQGAESIRAAAAADPELGRSLVSAFLMPPSIEALHRRLVGRGQDSPEVVARRMASARSEMEHWPHFDYVVVSGNQEEDLAAMRGLLTAERQRSARTRQLVID